MSARSAVCAPTVRCPFGISPLAEPLMLAEARSSLRTNRLKLGHSATRIALPSLLLLPAAAPSALARDVFPIAPEEREAVQAAVALESS